MAKRKEVEEGQENDREKHILEEDIEKCIGNRIKEDIKKRIKKRIMENIKQRIENDIAKRQEKGGENDPPKEKTVKHFIPSVTYKNMLGAPPADSVVVKEQGLKKVIHEYCPGGKGIWTDAL